MTGIIIWLSVITFIVLAGLFFLAHIIDKLKQELKAEKRDNSIDFQALASKNVDLSSGIKRNKKDIGLLTDELKNIRKDVKELQSDIQSLALISHGEQSKPTEAPKEEINKPVENIAEFGVYDNIIVRFDQIRCIYFDDNDYTRCYIRYARVYDDYQAGRFEIEERSEIIRLLKII